MNNFNLKTYINVSITEEVLKDFKYKKKRSINGSFDSFESWCYYIHNKFRNTRKVSDDLVFIIIPIVKALAFKYGLNIDESLDYIGKYFNNKLWNKYIGYTTARMESHGV
jgi:hypothetical protein